MTATQLNLSHAHNQKQKKKLELKMFYHIDRTQAAEITPGSDGMVPFANA